MKKTVAGTMPPRRTLRLWKKASKQSIAELRAYDRSHDQRANTACTKA